MKYAIIIPDGAADEPLAELGGRTPIEAAHTPHMDRVAAEGRQGLVRTAAVPPAVERQAVGIARGVLESLDVVGVLCVEFFLTRDGRLLINELAPRPHNSGHLTIDASVTSQFEQQLRAVCGLPLGSTARLRPAAAMANLLGDLWSAGEPNWPAALAVPDATLHLYGKTDPRPGRKMGHLTAVADTPADAALLEVAARASLAGGRESGAFPGF